MTGNTRRDRFRKVREMVWARPGKVVERPNPRRRCKCGDIDHCAECQIRWVRKVKSLVAALEPPEPSRDLEDGAMAFDIARQGILTPFQLEVQRGIRRLGHLPAMS
jgi:hypothetical protein